MCSIYGLEDLERILTLLIFLGRFTPAIGISGEEAACARVSAVDSILSPLQDSCLVVESSADVFELLGGVRFFVDVSVPRNVGCCMSELKSARVFSVDDLKEVVETNK